MKDTYLSLKEQFGISYEEVIASFPTLTAEQNRFYQETLNGSLPKEELEKQLSEVKMPNFDSIFELEMKLDSTEFKKQYKQEGFKFPETHENFKDFTEWKSLKLGLPKSDAPKLKTYLQIKKTLNRPEKSSVEIEKGIELENEANYEKADGKINGLDSTFKVKLLSNVFLNENKDYHPERNSLVHIKIVTGRGISTADEDLVNAALFHDIAKFEHVTMNPSGWPTSLPHEVKGAEYAKSAGMNEVVCYICNNHMRVKGWKGESEGGSLNNDTAWEVFFGLTKKEKRFPNPGKNFKEKAENFWKLITFTNMDSMLEKFDLAKSQNTWKKISSALKDEMTQKEFVEIWNANSVDIKMPSVLFDESGQPVKEETAPKQQNAFTAKELMAFGAKGPQIGEINKAIVGKTKEEAFEIIKQILGNPELKMESKRWIMTFESFKKNKHTKLLENIYESGEVRLIFPGDKYSAITDVKIQDGEIVGEDIEGVVNSYDDSELSTCFDKFKKAGLTVLNKTNPFSQEDADIVYSGWESRDGEDIEGFYRINLGPLNAAIRDGKIELTKDEDGDYEVKVK